MTVFQVLEISLLRLLEVVSNGLVILGGDVCDRGVNEHCVALCPKQPHLIQRLIESS